MTGVFYNSKINAVVNVEKRDKKGSLVLVSGKVVSKPYPIKAGDFATAPDYVAEHPYFKKLIESGQVLVVDKSAHDKEIQEAQLAAEKKAKAARLEADRLREIVEAKDAAQVTALEQSTVEGMDTAATIALIKELQEKAVAEVEAKYSKPEEEK